MVWELLGPVHADSCLLNCRLGAVVCLPGYDKILLLLKCMSMQIEHLFKIMTIQSGFFHDFAHSLIDKKNIQRSSCDGLRNFYRARKGFLLFGKVEKLPCEILPRGRRVSQRQLGQI